MSARSDEPDAVDAAGLEPAPRAPALVRRNADFRTLWAARTSSSIGDGFTAVAWMVYATDAHGSGLKLGALFVAEIAPTFLSPWLGLLSDRVDRRRVMVASELAQAAIMITLAAWLPAFPLLLVLAFLRSVAANAMKPAATSSITSLVPEADLAVANGWIRGGEEGAAVVAPLLAGLLAPVLHLRGMFALDAATFVIGATLLLRLPRIAPTIDAAEEDASGGALAGVRYVASHPTARVLAMSLFVFVLFAALENVPRPFLATKDLRAGDLGIGVLWGMAQVGMVLGLAAMGRLAPRARLGALLVAGMALYGVGSLVTCAAPTLIVAAAGQLISGIGNGLEVGAVDTLLQKAIAPKMLGRVLANVYGAASAAAGMAYAISGVMLDRSSPRAIFALVGGGCLAASLLTASLLPRGSLRRARSLDAGQPV